MLLLLLSWLSWRRELRDSSTRLALVATTPLSLRSALHGETDQGLPGIPGSTTVWVAIPLAPTRCAFGLAPLCAHVVYCPRIICMLMQLEGSILDEASICQGGHA